MCSQTQGHCQSGVLPRISNISHFKTYCYVHVCKSWLWETQLLSVWLVWQNYCILLFYPTNIKMMKVDFWKICSFAKLRPWSQKVMQEGRRLIWISIHPCCLFYGRLSCRNLRAYNVSPAPKERRLQRECPNASRSSDFVPSWMYCQRSLFILFPLPLRSRLDDPSRREQSHNVSFISGCFAFVLITRETHGAPPLRRIFIAAQL